MVTFVDGLQTDTYLGKYHEALSRLEELLQEGGRPQGRAYRALVVGAGLAPHDTFALFENSLPAEYRGAASALYSFEPFEVAAILQRCCAEYEIVVFDALETVLEKVRAQKTLPVDDFTDNHNGLRRYVLQLASTAPSASDPQLLAAINSCAEARTITSTGQLCFPFWTPRGFCST